MTSLAELVARAVGKVCDPEYPDITICQLGILEAVKVSATGVATVELVPTVLGCPAMGVIESDVRAAALGAGASEVTVRFLNAPAWTPARIQPEAALLLARDYTITIRRPGFALSCPRCGSSDVAMQSEFGSTPCRAVAWCPSCRNPVEVIRR